MKDVTPMSLVDKIKIFFFSALGVFFTALWFFGGFIGAIVAAFRGDLIHLVLSIFIPAYGAIYTVLVIIGSFFDLIF